MPLDLLEQLVLRDPKAQRERLALLALRDLKVLKAQLVPLVQLDLAVLTATRFLMELEHRVLELVSMVTFTLTHLQRRSTVQRLLEHGVLPQISLVQRVQLEQQDRKDLLVPKVRKVQQDLKVPLALLVQ